MKNADILAILQNVGAPVAFQEYTGTASTYVTFYFANEQGEAYADNDEIATGYLLNVDVWSKSNYSAVVDAVKIAMRDAGWRRRFAIDLYEKDTKVFHKALGFRCTNIV